MSEQLAFVGGSTEGELKRLGAEMAAALRERAALEAQLGVAEGQLAAARAHGEALEARMTEAQGLLVQVRKVGRSHGMGCQDRFLPTPCARTHTHTHTQSHMCACVCPLTQAEQELAARAAVVDTAKNESANLAAQLQLSEAQVAELERRQEQTQVSLGITACIVVQLSSCAVLTSMVFTEVMVMKVMNSCAQGWPSSYRHPRPPPSNIRRPHRPTCRRAPSCATHARRSASSSWSAPPRRAPSSRRRA